MYLFNITDNKELLQQLLENMYTNTPYITLDRLKIGNINLSRGNVKLRKIYNIIL